jgi:hypothetical protein
MRLPIHQRIVVFIGIIIVGLLTLGQLLDAVANAFAIVSSTVAVIGTVLLLLFLGAAQLWIKIKSPTWLVGNTPVKLKSLNVWWILTIAGMIILLWIPTFNNFIFGQKTDAEVKIKDDKIKTPTKIELPVVRLTTNNSLPLADFPNAEILSPKATTQLRSHNLEIENKNSVVLHNFTVRIQLPEPIVQEPLIKERPSGVEVILEPCRSESSLTGDSATAKRSNGRMTITTANKKGSSATVIFNKEVCAKNINNKVLSPTGIYELQIERLPSSSKFSIGFFTSNGAKARKYLEAEEIRSDSMFVDDYIDGSFQVITDGETKKYTIFVELKFDKEKRLIKSQTPASSPGLLETYKKQFGD